MTDKRKFTTYERDGESALDYAVFRSYTSRLGLFMTADPYDGSARVGDPQTWNRYAYVGIIRQVRWTRLVSVLLKVPTSTALPHLAGHLSPWEDGGLECSLVE
jgi:RHS repeat-associated protein